MALKKTLIDIVKDILSDLGGDEVDSIDDTFESSQVAQIVRSTYEAMSANRNWPHQKKLVQLTASGDVDFPTYVTLEDNIKELVSLQYDCTKAGETNLRYEDVKYKEPDDFLRYIYTRQSSNNNVLTITDPSGVKLFILNDVEPTYFTSFDDTTIIFDSYNSAVDSTIQTSKIICVAYVLDEWQHVDDFVPVLPADAFPALIEEAKSKSFMKVAQRVDQSAALEARRQQAWLSRKAWRVAGGIRYPSYGRKSGSYKKDVTFARGNT